MQSQKEQLKGGEIPHIQGHRKPSKMLGTGAAVRRYPMFKGKGAAPARR